MLEFLQSSTGVLPFFLTLASDHITGATGITPYVALSKNGGTFVVPSGTTFEMAYGWYGLRANAVDFNTLGALTLHATGVGCDPDDRTFRVSPTGVDANLISIRGSGIVLSSEPFDANIVKVLGSGVTAVTGNLNVNLIAVNGYSTSTATGVINANIVQVQGSGVTSTTGILNVNAMGFNGGVVDANIVKILGSGVTAVTGNLNVNLISINGASATSVTGAIDANIVRVLGSGVTATTGVLFVQSNATATVTGIVNANVTQWNSINVPVPTVTGIPDVNIIRTLGVPVPVGGFATSGHVVAIIADTDDIQTRLPANLFGGMMRSYLLSASGQVISSGTFNPDVRTFTQLGLATSGNVAGLQADTDDIQARLPAALVGGRIDASVGAMVAGVISSGVIASGSLQTISEGIFNSALDNTMTARQFLRALGALAGGQATGGGTSTVTFKALNDGATNRITMTVDGSGNRSSVTLNL